MKRLFLVLVLISLCLLSGCNDNISASLSNNEISEVETGDDTSQAIEEAGDITESNFNVGNIIEKMLVSYFNLESQTVEQIEKNKYKVNDKTLDFNKNSSNDFFVNVTDFDKENTETLFEVKNNVLDLRNDLKDEKKLSISLSALKKLGHGCVNKGESTNIFIELKGNDLNKTIKLNPLSNNVDKLTPVEKDKVIIGYESSLPSKHENVYILKDQNKLYAVSSISEDDGLKNLQVSHIILLPDDININMKKN